MNIEFEIPKTDDFKRVNELARQVHKIHINWNPDLFLDVDEVIPKDLYEELIQNRRICVAKLEQEIVGYAVFSIVEKTNPTMRYRKQINIEAICIDENYRGKGIGTLLLENIKAIGKEYGCTDMYLTVSKENENAIKVYEDFGFKVRNIAYLLKI